MPRLLNRVRPNPVHQPRQNEGRLADHQFTADGRLRRGLTTPRSYYRRFILRLLVQAEDHSHQSRDVRRTIQMRMAGRFTTADLSILRGKTPRWVNAMQWERKKMVMDGLLEPTSVAGHGIWRLTRKGIREAQS